MTERIKIRNGVVVVVVVSITVKSKIKKNIDLPVDCTIRLDEFCVNHRLSNGLVQANIKSAQRTSLKTINREK